jgi:hypothetical protein
MQDREISSLFDALETAETELQEDRAREVVLAGWLAPGPPVDGEQLRRTDIDNAASPPSQ